MAREAAAGALLGDLRAGSGHRLRIAGVVAAGRKARLCCTKEKDECREKSYERSHGETPSHWCLGRRVSYSGHPATGVQLQVTAGTTTAGVFGVMATKPMSLIGEFGPENTSLTAPVTGPTVPS